MWRHDPAFTKCERGFHVAPGGGLTYADRPSRQGPQEPERTAWASARKCIGDKPAMATILNVRETDSAVIAMPKVMRFDLLETDQLRDELSALTSGSETSRY